MLYNFTATCAPVFSLADGVGIHALLDTNLQAKFLKIAGLQSLNAVAASRESFSFFKSTSSRQSVIFSPSQSHFFT